MTSACRLVPARTRSAADPMPKQNPAQAAFRSNAPGAGMPIRSAVCAAAFGMKLGIVQVATMTVSISVGASPASFTARAPASLAMSTSDVSDSAMRRLWIPTRSRIHWSLVSMCWARSSLVTTLSGCALPRPVRRAPGMAAGRRRRVVMTDLQREEWISVDGRVEVVRGSQGQGRDALQLALDQPDQGARRRQLEHRGDPELAQRGHAGVPPDRPGDLRDQSAQGLGAGAEHPAVGVGQQRPARVGRVEVRRRTPAAPPRREP